MLQSPPQRGNKAMTQAQVFTLHYATASGEQFRTTATGPLAQRALYMGWHDWRDNSEQADGAPLPELWVKHGGQPDERIPFAMFPDSGRDFAVVIQKTTVDTFPPITIKAGSLAEAFALAAANAQTLPRDTHPAQCNESEVILSVAEV